MKPCSKCLRLLKIDNFSPDKKNKSGLRSCCKKCSKEMHKKWLALNPDKMARAKRNWNKNNPEKVKEQKRRSREINKEKISIRDKLYRKKNPLVIKAINCNAKARARIKCDSIPTKELIDLINKHKNTCAYCGIVGKMSFDHKNALSAGGKHNITNLVIACPTCNNRKKNKSVKEYIKYCEKIGIKLNLSPLL